MGRGVEPSNPLVNAVFGELMPDAPPENVDPHDVAEHDDHEQWLRDNVPPHHH
jgi:hypothetical protein